MQALFFKSASDFRDWLEANHNKETELKVGICKKKSGRPSVAYSEAVDQALCFGWIDGVRNRIDAASYQVRFTPRKPKSQWSDVNIRRVLLLIEQGKMASSGLAAFAGAKTQARAYSYEQENTAKLDASGGRRFQENQAAWKFFQTQPAWYRRTAIWWVVSAKKEQTRVKRLNQLIAHSAEGLPIPPLRRKPPNSRNGNKSD